jgi:hypothetical protein
VPLGAVRELDATDILGGKNVRGVEFTGRGFVVGVSRGSACRRRGADAAERTRCNMAGPLVHVTVRRSTTETAQRWICVT